jgi:2-amino-4-hydroxy-6-hydroxymethyldihydropteridine diphosphokinase
LLHRVLEIERELGRQRRDRWEPRTIDLDLLLYGNQIISSQELIVPHPLMHERRFVLAPLAELVPNLVHQTLQMTIAGMLEDVKSRGEASSSIHVKLE